LLAEDEGKMSDAAFIPTRLKGYFAGPNSEIDWLFSDFLGAAR
jgi:hypothetical protein